MIVGIVVIETIVLFTVTFITVVMETIVLVTGISATIGTEIIVLVRVTSKIVFHGNHYPCNS